MKDESKPNPAWVRVEPECMTLTQGGLAALIERNWRDDFEVRALEACLHIVPYAQVLVSGRLDPRDRSALERVVREGRAPSASFSRQSCVAEAFRFLAIDDLRPGGAAELIRRSDEIGLPPVNSFYGSGSLVTCPTALGKLREAGRVREEDLAAIEAAVRGPIDPRLLAGGNPEPARTLARIAAERARNR